MSRFQAVGMIIFFALTINPLMIICLFLVPILPKSEIKKQVAATKPVCPECSSRCYLINPVGQKSAVSILMPSNGFRYYYECQDCGNTWTSNS